MEIAEQTAAVLTEAGIDADKAVSLGNEIAIRMAELWGGRPPIYIPKAFFAKRGLYAWLGLSARDREIYRAFNGANREEVLQRYGISQTRLYEIVSAVRQGMKVQLVLEELDAAGPEG